MDLFTELLANKILVAAIIGWFVAQFLKVIFVLISDRKFDFHRMIGSGGMPSSHSAFVIALTTAVGFEEGLRSTLFAICVVLASVVMYDASGVRRAAGQQAERINQLVENFDNDEIENDDEKLKELLGHTPFEVFAGALVGILVGVLMYRI